MKKVVHGIITIMKRKFQLYSDGQQFHHNQQIKQPPLQYHMLWSFFNVKWFEVRGGCLIW
jgi:hypothetical protein